MPQTKLAYGLSSMRSLICSYKRKAKKRGHTYELTEEEFKEITQKPCFYCGQEPNQIAKYETKNGHYIYNGIDRKDNNIGYTYENSLPCCGLCNREKGRQSFKQFDDWLNKVVKFRVGCP